MDLNATVNDLFSSHKSQFVGVGEGENFTIHDDKKMDIQN